MSRPGRFLILTLLALAVAAGSLTALAGAETPAPRARAAADASGWSTSATTFRGRNGERFTYDCPKYGSRGSVWGTDVYTDDSSVCSAAVHAGVIALAGGGSVTIEIQPGAASYTGSTRNRVTTSDWGAYQGSFVIVGGLASDPGVAPGGNPGGNPWAQTAAAYRTWVGAQYSYNCPAGGTPYPVYGRNVYTADSSVCTAAVHGGLITFKSGGTVTVEMRDGLSSYTASKRNGVETRAWGAYDASFVVLDAPDGPDTPEGIATGEVLVNGKRFSAGAVRYGSTIDVTRGTLKLTAAGVGSIFTFGDGTDPARFKLNKLVTKVRKKRRVSAELALTGGDFSSCSGAARASAGPKGKVVQSLWASGKGRFRTKGRYATATIRGTKWQTTDQCDGTLTSVVEGAILVRDLRLKKNVVVQSGSSYLAKAP